MKSETRTIELRIKEYNDCGGCTECVHNEKYQATWIGRKERTVRNFLAGGDYSEGEEDRTVEVYVDGEEYATYSAPQIRRFKHRAGTL